MCLYYSATRKPAFTRLCYRYGDMRGQRVPGRWRCGEYPKPTRRRSGPTPGTAARTRIPVRTICVCYRPVIPGQAICEECYIQQQFHTTDADTARSMLEAIIRDPAAVARHYDGTEQTAATLTEGETS